MITLFKKLKNKREEKWNKLLSEAFFIKTGLKIYPYEKKHMFKDFTTENEFIIFNKFLKKERDRMRKVDNIMTINMALHCVISIPSTLILYQSKSIISIIIFISIVLISGFILIKNAKQYDDIGDFEWTEKDYYTKKK